MKVDFERIVKYRKLRAEKDRGEIRQHSGKMIKILSLMIMIYIYIMMKCLFVCHEK